MNDFWIALSPHPPAEVPSSEGKSEVIMIHHVSFSARDPKHVAEVLAELMCGRAYSFPGSVPDSWMAVSGDECGTMIEVYPEDITLEPGRTAGVPFRFLLSVPVDHGTIERIGKREGWRTELCSRGAPGRTPFFHVVEFWVEDRLMLELAPEEMMDGYMEQMQLPVLDGFFGSREATKGGEAVSNAARPVMTRLAHAIRASATQAVAVSRKAMPGMHRA